MAGVGVGFVLGSRAGRGPYQRLESKARELSGRPEVHDKVVELRSTAVDQAGSVAHKVGDRLGWPGSRNDVPETVMGEEMGARRSPEPIGEV